MDAATAALLGASIGLAGALVAPVVTAYQAKRAKREDLMREAYARGFACLARIPRCDTSAEHARLRDKMLEALAHIDIVGTKATSDHYSALVEGYETWKIGGGTSEIFEASARKFQASARTDIASADASRSSAAALVSRVVVIVLALAFYWWARFPALLESADRVLGGIEFAVAAVATMFGIFAAAATTIRLVRAARWS
ncbi:MULTISPECIES: hypothetical protein [Amycolatopsis]|uniref:Uncharacterized protein n=1 Tax=Amycolatopsis echigonensis TaxID=2576905 RepID=A0A8E1VUC8_9PSEU|nr:MULTISPECIES: hypothetical protein [Amycolatopsis]MBB2498433.1 hypothetical protein [Amycolatopsis echigonensis]